MAIVATINEVVELTAINCGECGGTYAINERYRKQKEQKGGGWNCPYCDCSWGYFGKTEAQRLKEQLEAERRGKELAQKQAERERERTAAANRRARAQKAAKTRVINRVKNGVCPCCNRHFANLHRHMQSQHPDFEKKGGKKK